MKGRSPGEAGVKVLFADRQREVALRRAEVIALAKAASPARWRGKTLSVVLVDGREMTELNGRFTGREGDTDVLAFDLESPPDETVGEIIVNAARAVEEARARGVTPREELALYVAHGLAHLLGFDDHCAADRRRMYAREESILGAAGWRSVRNVPRGGERPC